MHTRTLLRACKLQLPPSARLTAQLKAVTSTPLPGGGIRITSPRRAGQGHGDIVSALVLGAWHASSRRWRSSGEKPRALPPRVTSFDDASLDLVDAPRGS